MPQGRKNIKLQKLVELKNLRHWMLLSERLFDSASIKLGSVSWEKRELWELRSYYHLPRLPLLDQSDWKSCHSPTLASLTGKKREERLIVVDLISEECFAACHPSSTSFHTVYTFQSYSSKHESLGTRFNKHFNLFFYNKYFCNFYLL